MKKQPKCDLKIQPQLVDKVGRTSLDVILRRALELRKITDNSFFTEKDGVTYEGFTHNAGGTEYVIRPIHVTINEVSEYGNSRCNVCWGKGYKSVQLSKKVLRNPKDHVILSKKSFKDLDDKEKEKLIEEERKSTTWSVLLPCECAVRAMQKAIPNFFASGDRSIMFMLEYEEKPEVKKDV